MKIHLLAIICIPALFSCGGKQTSMGPFPDSSGISFPLQAYVEAEDPAFTYDILDSLQGEGWTEYRIKMISGNWLSPEEVDESTWWHWLTVIFPDRPTERGSLMLIGGGSREDLTPIPANGSMVRAALATHSVITHISNIPFQPLDFSKDPQGQVYEDDLIAFAWRQFLLGGATEDLQDWLPRFPMTRAVCRAMDVVQELARDREQAIDSFVVAGASKRGWTTWNVAAVDERVMGIAPVVIDLLNLIPSFQHHWRCYGEWAPAIDPYVHQGIMDWMDTEEFQSLLDLVEPYQFLDRLRMPKFLINAASDEFFVSDSWQFYWEALQGEKYLRYVPNAGHGLHGSYLPAELVAFYQHLISGEALPDFQWRISGDSIFAQVDPGSPYQINRWEATNPEGRDFRSYVIGESWRMTELEWNESGHYALVISPPQKGYKASLLEVVFHPEAAYPLTLSSGILVCPDTYPYSLYKPAEIQRE